jgi:uncharacterized membrane protein YedE/YeeE
MPDLEALGVGFCFGFLLQKAGLSRYDRIVNVYLFRDLSVIKFLLSALVVGAFGIQVLLALGVAVEVPTPPTFLLGNLSGGLVFGVGMALSGFCPGTIAAGVGEGRLDYLLPGSLGLIAGALVYGSVYRVIMPIFGRSQRVGLTLAQVFDADSWLVVVLLAELSGLLFYVIDAGAAKRRTRRAGDSPPAR